jgi:hypothetical protein
MFNYFLQNNLIERNSIKMKFPKLNIFPLTSINKNLKLSNVIVEKSLILFGGGK